MTGGGGSIGAAVRRVVVATLALAIPAAAPVTGSAPGGPQTILTCDMMTHPHRDVPGITACDRPSALPAAGSACPGQMPPTPCARGCIERWIAAGLLVDADIEARVVASGPELALRAPAVRGWRG